MANRVDIRTAARLELADPSGSGVRWSDDVLNRAIDEVTADITRVMPDEKIEEILVDFQVDDESITIPGTAAFTLANKPIEWQSENVTNAAGTTTYTLNTDYTMDYANGTITRLSGGAITANQILLVDYKKSRIAFDLSGITDLLVPVSVEWPVGDVPQSEAAFTTWGGVLWMTSSITRSQTKAGDKQYIRVYYHAQYAPPDDDNPGSFPRFMDEVAVKGVVAYALFIRHRESNHEAQGASNSADAALGGVTLPIGRINTAMTALTATNGPHARMATALEQAGPTLVKADALLLDVATDIATARTALAKVTTHSSTQAAAALDKVDTHLAAAGGAKTALDLVQGVIDQATASLSAVPGQDAKVDAALAKIATYLEGSSDSAKAALNDILSKTVFADANTALDLVATYLDLVHNAGATTGDLEKAEDVFEGGVSGDTAEIPGQVDHIEASTGGGSGTGIDNAAQDYLDAGDPLINAVNLGSQAAELNRRYAETQLALAQMYADRRRDFISEADRHTAQAQTYIAEAGARMAQADRLAAEAAEWSRLAQTFIAEAAQHNVVTSQAIARSGQYNQSAEELIGEGAQRVAIADSFIRESQERNQISLAFISEAQGRVAVAQTRLLEVQNMISIGNSFINEANQWADKAQIYINEAGTWIANIEAINRSAQQYIFISTRMSEIGIAFLDDARERHNDYWSMLNSRVHTARQFSKSSPRQYSSAVDTIGPDVPRGPDA